jgi:hypothetical protein
MQDRSFDEPTTVVIATGFLNGMSLSFLIATCHTSAVEIYNHLQFFFRQSRTQTGTARIQHQQIFSSSTALSDQCLLAHLIKQVQQQNQQLIACKAALEKARDEVSHMIARNEALTIQRDCETQNFVTSMRNMREIISRQHDEITLLQKKLEDERHAHQTERNTTPVLADRIPIAGDSVGEALSETERHALELFHQGKDLPDTVPSFDGD